MVTKPKHSSTKLTIKRRLTPKQDMFVNKYIEKQNGRQAAIASGYTSKTPEVIASQNLRKDNIQEEMKSRMESAGFDKDFIAKRLKVIAEEGTSSRALEKTSVTEALKALQLGSDIYGLLGRHNKTENKTLIVKADLSKKTYNELKDEMIKLREEEEKYLTD